MSELQKAEYWHRAAQKSGKAEDYNTAAYWYDLAGKFSLAEQCREAAELLAK